MHRFIRVVSLKIYAQNQVNRMNVCYVTTPCECDMIQKINMAILQRFALLLLRYNRGCVILQLLCDQVRDVEAIYCLSQLLTASGNFFVSDAR